MGVRRMFSKVITESGRFLKMPPSSQALYFQLGMNADDDGVVEAFKVMKLTNSNDDDLKVLVSKNFIKILNEDLVSFIMDWTEHNLIRADRKIDSIYKDLLLQIVPEIEILEAKPRADTKKLTGGLPMDVQRTAQDKISKDKKYYDSASLVPLPNPPVSVKDTKKKKTTSEEDSRLHKESVDLIDYWKEKWQTGVGKEPSVTSWGRYIKQAKPLIKQLGLERMKTLCDAYFITFDDKFIKENNWSLNIFLTDAIINKLNSKYN